MVCADADDLAEKVTADAIEGRLERFGPLSVPQRDALAWTGRWDAAGAYAMAGLTYRLVYRTQRLVIATLVLAVLGSRLIDLQSQKMTVAARATAERKVFAHRS